MPIYMIDVKRSVLERIYVTADTREIAYDWASLVNVEMCGDQDLAPGVLEEINGVTEVTDVPAHFKNNVVPSKQNPKES